MADQPSLNIAPELPISPEEDATLQAIEAMEAKSVDLDTPRIPTPAPTPVVTPEPIQVISEVTPVASQQPVAPVQPIAPEPQARVPANAAEAIAEELAKASNEPQSAVFQFFVKQKPSRNTLIFAAVGIGLAVLIGIGSIFLFQSV